MMPLVSFSNFVNEVTFVTPWDHNGEEITSYIAIVTHNSYYGKILLDGLPLHDKDWTKVESFPNVICMQHSLSRMVTIK